MDKCLSLTGSRKNNNAQVFGTGVMKLIGPLISRLTTRLHGRADANPNGFQYSVKTAPYELRSYPRKSPLIGAPLLLWTTVLRHSPEFVNLPADESHYEFGSLWIQMGPALPPDAPLTIWILVVYRLAPLWVLVIRECLSSSLQLC